MLSLGLVILELVGGRETSNYNHMYSRQTPSMSLLWASGFLNWILNYGSYGNELRT